MSGIIVEFNDGKAVGTMDSACSSSGCRSIPSSSALLMIWHTLPVLVLMTIISFLLLSWGEGGDDMMVLVSACFSCV